MEKRNGGHDDLFSGMIKTLGVAIKKKDAGLKEHSERVANLSVSFAKNIGLSALDVKNIYLAGLFHDVGKLYLSLRADQRPGNLSKEQLDLYRRHPEISAHVLSKIARFKGALPMIRHHHEAYNGGGYPNGLKAKEIPMGAKVIGLVDYYDNLVAARPGGKALPVVDALKTMVKSANTMFDGKLITSFIKFISTVEAARKEVKPESKKEIPEKKEVKPKPGPTGYKDPKTILSDVLRRINNGEVEQAVLPQVVQSVQKALEGSTTIDDVVEELEKDAAITLKLISVSNSSWYGGYDKMHTVQRAVGRLGLKETRNIVTTIALKQVFSSKDKRLKKILETLWLHSLACAYSTRVIAKKVGEKEMGEDLFLMGLLHDIGKVQILSEFFRVAADNPLVETEETIKSIKSVHRGLGGRFVKSCNFPDMFVQAVTRQGDANIKESTGKHLLIVNLANHMAYHLEYGLEKREESLPDLDSAVFLGLGEEALDDMCEEIKEMMSDAGSIF
ncbi:MAG: HDOD domain-containing protein [Desulfobacterales bacterium]|nr:HDOD domain-containing protein [Desulfobacterales bacterium]